jgi:hypothetical protein
MSMARFQDVSIGKGEKIRAPFKPFGKSGRKEQEGRMAWVYTWSGVVRGGAGLNSSGRLGSWGLVPLAAALRSQTSSDGVPASN